MAKISRKEIRYLLYKMEKYGHILNSIYENVKLGKELSEEQELVFKLFDEFFDKEVPVDLVANQAVE